MRQPLGSDAGLVYPIRMRRGQRLGQGRGVVLAFTALAALSLMTGCSVDLNAAAQDVGDDLQEVGEDIGDGLQAIWDDVTELSDPEDSFTGRVMVLGQRELPEGGVQIYLQGADESGAALATAAFEQVQVFLDGELVHGCEQVPASASNPDAGMPAELADAEVVSEPAPGATEERCVTLDGVQVRFLAELEGTVFSVSVVNDYSGSMADADLELVSEIQTALFEALPPIFETEVVYFADLADTVLPFTTDRDAVLGAVQPDLAYERGFTALYDGMGAGLTTLTEREAPVRILMVSTDGHENASEQFTQPQLRSTIDENGIITVMLGSRFSNVEDLKSFASGRGVFFYTPAFRELKERVAEYVESLLATAELTLPPELDGEDVEIRVNGIPAAL